MANPTALEIFGVATSDVEEALATLNLGEFTDARLAAYSIVNLLFTKLSEVVEVEGDLLTYKITKSIANVDLETQVQTYNLSFSLAITAASMSVEA